jgi:succinate dehydrogenase hydrophobic anchor subunit
MNTIALIIPQDFANNVAPVILLILILIPLVVALFQWLWNITMPQVFNLNTVTFWQAFRLLLISSLLFKSGGGGS